MTRETVAVDTPARPATSLIVLGLGSPASCRPFFSLSTGELTSDFRSGCSRPLEAIGLLPPCRANYEKPSVNFAAVTAAPVMGRSQVSNPDRLYSFWQSPANLHFGLLPAASPFHHSFLSLPILRMPLQEGSTLAHWRDCP